MLLGFSISSLLFVQQENMMAFYTGLIVLLVVGFLDDFMSLRAKWKFIAQLLASGLLVYFNRTILSSLGNFMSLGTIDLGVFAIPTTIFCIVGIINAINMIDGLDGLAGGISLIAFISFAILAYLNNQIELMLLSIALSGAVIGFLIYNWHPSKLFMGDTGSLFLGFSLAFLSIAITQKDNSVVPPVVPLLILAVPIVDTVTIMAKRITEGRSPFVADKDHLHHVILRLGLNNKNAVKVILLMAAIFSCLGIIGTIIGISQYYLFSIFSIYFVAVVIHFGFAIHLKKMIRIFIRLLEESRWEYMELKILVKKAMRFLDIIHLSDEHKHYHVNLPLSCFLKGKGRYYACKGTLIDIGTGGFSTSLSKDFTIGEKKDFNIQLTMNGKLITTAEVVWLIKEKNNGYRYGFKFVDIDKKQIDALCDYLQQLDTNIKYDRNLSKRLEQIPINKRIDIPAGYDIPCINQKGNDHKDSIDMTCSQPCQLFGIKEYSILDESVLYCPEREMAFSLNSSAKAIWKLCDGRHTIFEISKKIDQRFGCSGTELLSDVKTSIMKLLMLGLLEMREVSV